MSARPQPLQDIEERIELLKTTLGLFAPDEPEPIAKELCELGEDILVHWLIRHGSAEAQGSLSELATETVRRDGGLAAAADICREMMRLKDLIAAAPDDAATGERLVALATVAGGLYALAAR